MKCLDRLAPHAHWFLRLAYAAIFLYAGIMKFQMGIENFAGMLKMPLFVAVLVALAEIGGACFVLLGGITNKSIFTRIGGLFTTIVMIGAFFLANLPTGWSEGTQINMVMFALSIYFLFKGN